MTLSTAESLTGGNIGALITSKQGSSHYYKGGVICYTLESKVNILNIDKEEAEKCNCVSSEIAEVMAKNVSLLFDSDIGISTTGYIDNVPDKSISGGNPYCYIGIYIKNTNQTLSKFYVCINNNRIDAQKEIANISKLYFDEYIK